MDDDEVADTVGRGISPLPRTWPDFVFPTVMMKRTIIIENDLISNVETQTSVSHYNIQMLSESTEKNFYSFLPAWINPCSVNKNEILGPMQINVTNSR